LDAPEASEIPEATWQTNLKLLWVKKRPLAVIIVNKANHVELHAWVLGDRSAKTFEQLWSIIKCWNSFFHATDAVLP